MFNWCKRLVIAAEDCARLNKLTHDAQIFLLTRQAKVLEAVKEGINRRDALDGRITILEAELAAHKELKRHSRGKSHEDEVAEFDRTHGLDK